MIGLLYKSNLVKIIFKIELLAFLIIDIIKYKVSAQNYPTQKGIFPYTPLLWTCFLLFFDSAKGACIFIDIFLRKIQYLKR
ncbi:hypothetical protein CMU94_17955 [Elizabethkingia anophelis]|nr:hypothetical protein [Elizabethkingia anophelis]